MTGDSESSSYRPTNPEKILKVINTQANSCGPRDTLLISLSGHGVQFKDEEELSTGVKETYFCPEDADIDDKETLIPISAIVKIVDDCLAGRKLILIDSCRNEVLSSAGQRKSAKTIDLGSVHENRLSIPDGMYTLFSCKSSQFSWEHEDLGHSVFSYYVNRFLSGQADEKYYDDGKLDIDSLNLYVRKKTNDYVFSQGLSSDGQLPVMRGGVDAGNWQIGKISLKAYVDSTGAKFVRIKPGTFQMGSKDSPESIARLYPDENADAYRNEHHPQVTVNLTRGLFVGAHEVTRGQFKQFVRESGYRTDAERGVRSDDNPTGAGAIDGTRNWREPGFSDLTDDHPVSMISWNDAQEYCEWLSRKESRTVRLPTQAEWEYFCRAGTTTRYWTGDSVDSLVKGANLSLIHISEPTRPY